MIIIVVRTVSHNLLLLQGVGALAVDTTKLGIPNGDSELVGEEVLTGPVDALEPEPSRRLRHTWDHSGTGISNSVSIALKNQ